MALYLLGDLLTDIGTMDYAANTVVARGFTADFSHALDTIKVYSRAAGQVKVALYANSSGSPGTLLVANNTATTVSSGQWNDISIGPIELTEGTTYHIVAVGSTDGAVSRTAYTSGYVAKYSATFSSWSAPAPWTGGSSIYAEEAALAGYSNDGFLLGDSYPGGHSAVGNYVFSRRFVATAGGTANKISIYSLSSGTAKVAVYSDNATNDAPDQLLGSNDVATTIIGGRWNAISLPDVSIVDGQGYWVSVAASTNGVVARAYGSGGTSHLKIISYSTYAFPSTWHVDSSASTYEYSFTLYGDTGEVYEDSLLGTSMSIWTGTITEILQQTYEDSLLGTSLSLSTGTIRETETYEDSLLGTSLSLTTGMIREMEWYEALIPSLSTWSFQCWRVGEAVDVGQCRHDGIHSDRCVQVPPPHDVRIGMSSRGLGRS